MAGFLGTRIALATLAGLVASVALADAGACDREDAAATSPLVSNAAPTAGPLSAAIAAEVGHRLRFVPRGGAEAPEGAGGPRGFRVDGPRHGIAAFARVRALRVVPLWTGHSMSLFIGLDARGRPGLQFQQHGAIDTTASLTDLPAAVAQFR